MSRIIYLNFIEQKSTFDVLYFEVYEFKGEVVEFTINIRTGENKLKGIGEIKNQKIIQTSFYNLSKEEQNIVWNKEFRNSDGRGHGNLSNFTFSKVKKILNNSKIMSYVDFIDWVRNSLINK